MTLFSASDVEVIYGEGCGRCAELVQGAEGTNRCPNCNSVVACGGLSLTLHRGEVLGIVGESGSGKSTLAETLALAHDADAGRVTLGNSDENLLDIAYDDRIHRRTEDIGLVHQSVSDGLLQPVSGGGNVARPLLRTGWRRYDDVRSRAIELFEATEIPVDRLDDPVETYSGGMQRRVQLAAAIATEPDVLVLDEPTTGLDVSVQAQILDLFRQLQRGEQIATIIVSHDLSVIRLLADRTLVMKNGQIIERGLTDRILEDPHEEYTQLLVNSTI